jgi:RimJ/RimL family protein N-acetyltransferase
MSVFVRPATADDLDALLDVQQEGAVAGLAHIFPQELYPFPRLAVRRRWAEELDDPSTHVYICVDGEGEVVGFAATQADELLHFGTAVRTWGTGTAEQLHNALLGELARTAPTESGDLRLRVFEANTRARRFYETLGWRATAQRTRSTFAPYAVLVEYHRPRPAPHQSPGLAT